MSDNFNLAKYLRDNGATDEHSRKPLWKGPEQDGITFSLLSRFLCCRERFRLYVIEGLRVRDQFNHKLEFGSMWHVCEESLSGVKQNKNGIASALWNVPLVEYAQKLCEKYPLAQEEIDKWYNVCKIQFPIYKDFWLRHPEVTGKIPILQEKAFRIPYTLPSGRVVTLRGKWDSIDLIKGENGKEIWLQENKTKGDIRPANIEKQLKYDLQTMIYLVALKFCKRAELNSSLDLRKIPLAGVRYNVVRRPLSGGKGTITRKKGKPARLLKSGKWSVAKPAETTEAYYKRLAGYIKKEPEAYFMRWNVTVDEEEIDEFRMKCLDPILEQLCDWWEWINSRGDHYSTKKMEIQGVKGKIPVGNATHWIHPYGVFNALNEGGQTEYDDIIGSGSEIGLERTNNLFPELS